MSIELTEQQTKGIDLFCEWYHNPQKQDFFLAGYAGTGKTTLLLPALDKLGIPLNKCAFATFTGKAALQITRNSGGKIAASTLHKLLYDVTYQHQRPVFIPKDLATYRDIDFFGNDEGSMTSAKLYEDLARIGKKTAYIGDPGQLPPIGEPGRVYTRLKESPDVMLTEIHRQAKGDPIIQTSFLAREEKPIVHGSYARSDNKQASVHVIPLAYTKSGAYLDAMYRADQVLCGKNATRRRLNRLFREKLSFGNQLVNVGEKIICLKNTKVCIGEYPLVNGMIGYITKIHGQDRKVVVVDFRPEFLSDQTITLQIWKAPFEGKEVDANDKLYGSKHGIVEFDYGYAITTHRSQGSQWDKVFVLNEGFYDAKLNRYGYHKEWLYTAITRASQRLILAIN